MYLAAKDLCTGPEALTYDDVLVLPGHSEVLPKDTQIAAVFAGTLRLPVPIIAAAMDTVTEWRMAWAMASLGGLGVLHKNMSAHAQAQQVAEVKKHGALKACAAHDALGRAMCGAAIGAGDDAIERASILVAAGTDVLVVDTAHGHSQAVLNTVRALKARWAQLPVWAGNVVTPEATLSLIDAGADVIKVGVGPGSICTTRQVAGVGMPQLSAVAACAHVAHAHGRSIVADGGIKTSGDIVKALAAGAQAVMLGSLLAGSDEAAGALIDSSDGPVKAYRGMGSKAAMLRGSADRYFQAETKPVADKLTAEGIEATVRAKGPLAPIMAQLTGGLKNGMGYVGAKDIAALQKRARFVKISLAGLHESMIHSVVPQGVSK